MSKFEEGLTDKEVEELIVERVWPHFQDWMRGQTAPILSDGSYGYYPWDVSEYLSKLVSRRLTVSDW